MNAELDENGVMLITPETPTEAYALKRWVDESLVEVKDATRHESGYWRSSKLITSAVVPNA